VAQCAGLAEDAEHNEVVEELVETELERLDTLEWRLARIRKRLIAAAKSMERRLQQTAAPPQSEQQQQQEEGGAN